MTYWHIGKVINDEVLDGQRAHYAEEIVVTPSRQLAAKYGRGFGKSYLHRMMQFAQVFPDERKVVTLSPQLSWSHFLALLPVRSDAAREFCIEQTFSSHLSVYYHGRGVAQQKVGGGHW